MLMTPPSSPLRALGSPQRDLGLKAGGKDRFKLAPAKATCLRRFPWLRGVTNHPNKEHEVPRSRCFGVRKCGTTPLSNVEHSWQPPLGCWSGVVTNGPRRAYSQALSAIADGLGRDLPVDQLDSRKLLDMFQQRRGSAQPSTWNTRITAVKSFFSFCRRNGWLDHDPMALVDRRRQPRDQTIAIPYQDLERLWSRRDISLREK